MAMCQQWEELQATKGASRRTEPEDVFKVSRRFWDGATFVKNSQEHTGRVKKILANSQHLRRCIQKGFGRTNHEAGTYF